MAKADAAGAEVAIIFHMQAVATFIRAVTKEEFWVYLLVFFLPLQTRWIIRPGTLNGGYWEYGTFALYVVDVLAVALLVGRLVRAARAGQLQRWVVGGARRPTFWLLAGLLELAVIISVLYASNEGLALYGYLRFVLAMGVGWLVLHSRVRVAGIGRAWLGSGAVQGTLALWQAGAQRVTGSTAFGMAAQRAQDAGVSVVELLDGRWLRAYGSLPHPNIMGGWLALALVIGVSWQAQQRLTARRGNRLQYWHMAFGWLALGVSAAGLLLSFSRAAWLAAAAGLGVLAVGALWLKRATARRSMLVAASVVAMLVAATGGVWYRQAAARGGAGRLEQRSFHERLQYAQDARAVIAAHPVGGAGVHNYGIAVHDAVDSQRSSYAYEPVHNTLLLVWAEIGVVGLLAYTAVMAYVLAVAWARRAPVALAVAVTVSVLALFDHWLWSLPFGLYAWWLALAVSQRMAGNS